MQDKTLAEFERLCLEGPLDALTPEDTVKAYSRVSTLAGQYMRRVQAQAEKWKAPPKPKRRAAAAKKVRQWGLEMSLPAGDRD